LALSLPQADITAVDISEAALVVAHRNAETHKVSNRVRFKQGNLLEPVNGRLDLIVANLPYITDAEWTGLADGVKSYEPTSALRGGRSGLDFIEQLLIQAKDKLAPEGAIFLEIGWRQGPAAVKLAQSYFPVKQINLLVDFAGNDRIVSIT
jgi:release factor glutamine methyltransferase